MDCTDYYSVAFEQQRLVLKATCESANFKLQAESHNFLTDLQSWLNILDKRPEARVLQKATSEFQAGLSLLTTGHYRYAFVSLRSFLELSIAAVQHSTNLLHHRQWTSGRRDVVWASLVDTELGVLSQNFCKEFAPTIDDDVPHVNSLARGVYRCCSEFAHGNAVLDAIVPPMFEYSGELFEKWHETAASARYVTMFCLCMRYLNEVETGDLASIESCLQDSMGHLQFVRDALARQHEG